MSAAAEPDSLGIAIPEAWIQIPVDRGEYDAFVTRLRDRWKNEAKWDRPTQRQAELLLTRIRRDILRGGIQFVGLFVGEPAEADLAEQVPVPGGDPEQEHDEILMAACTVGTYTKESLGAQADLTLGNLTMAFGRKPRSEPHVKDQRYKRITNLEPPVYHEIPIGKSVRLRRLYELVSPGLFPQRFFGESYLTPIGGDGKRCVMAHFVTMNIQLSQLFSDLFERIAGTITYYADDDETKFESEWVDLPDD